MLSGSKVNAITVLGAGEAGFSFIKQARSINPDVRITLIDKNAYYLDKSKFFGSMDFKAYMDLNDFSKENNVAFIQDTVERINPKQKKIYLKQSEPLDFETLVIASGAKSKSISLKGERREGLVYLSDIDIFEFKNFLKISNEIIVYVTTYLGLKLSMLLKSSGKDVRILGDNWDFLGSNKEKVVNFLTGQGVNVHLNVTIDEVIGEGQVKATKISPLKVFSSQMVLLDTAFLPNLDFFEAPINITNIFMLEQTALPGSEAVLAEQLKDIFLIGDCARKDIETEHFYAYNFSEARSQADVLAQFLFSGKEHNFAYKTLSEEDKQKMIDEFMASGADGILESQNLDKTII